MWLTHQHLDRYFHHRYQQMGCIIWTGSQRSQTHGLSGSTLGWQTTWTWANAANYVKSYTNVESSTTSCTQLSAYNTSQLLGLGGFVFLHHVHAGNLRLTQGWRPH